MSTERNLSDYTESDDMTHEQAKARIYNVMRGRGYEDRVSAKDLSEQCPGVAPSTVRDLVKEVRKEYNLPIYSRGSSGYWVLQDGEELDDAIKHIRGNIETKRETMRDLAAAYNSDQLR